MTRTVHADARRDQAVVGWGVVWDAPGYPDRSIARLAMKRLSLYVLLVDTLAGVQEQLPSRLVRAERQPADPPEVVEVWFAWPRRRDLFCRMAGPDDQDQSEPR